jgi:hypothetical protein
MPMRRGFICDLSRPERGTLFLALQDLRQLGWSLSPDGAKLAIVTGEEQEGRIRILSLTGGAVREITVRGGGQSWSLAWVMDGKGFYVACRIPPTLLHVDLAGHAQVLRQVGPFFDIYGLPSPDGRYLALQEWGLASPRIDD